MDHTERRCTCKNVANCAWGAHGFIEPTSSSPVTAARLKLYAEHEAIGLPDYQSAAAKRQTQLFQQLVHL